MKSMTATTKLEVKVFLGSLYIEFALEKCQGLQPQDEDQKQIYLSSHYIDYQEMGVRLWISIILFVGVFAFDNFQRRAIYYDEKDNVCHFGERSDLIRITLFIDGLETKEVVGYGRTHCDQWIQTDAARIQPAKYWLAASQDFKQYYLKFDDETKITYMRGVLFAIIQKSTVRSPAILNGTPYDCTIIGDGNIYHFGINFTAFQPAQIYIKCNKSTADPAISQKQ